MAILTEDQVSVLTALIHYLDVASAGKHIDDRVTDTLARIFGDSCGFVCGCPGTLLEALRDQPYVALLQLLLCVDNDLILSVAESDRIQASIDRIKAGSAGKYLDELSVEELARVFGNSCGFVCGCPGSLIEGLRDSPVSTLLELILCLNAGGNPVDVVEESGPAGPPPFPADEPCEGLWLFAVLAGSTVTNTGNTVVTGDLGLSPGSDVTGFPPGVVIGDQHVTDVTAAEAQVQLTAAYLDLAGRTSDGSVAGDIGGQTLAPGVYTAAAALEITTADLTLDAGGNADAVFVFQIGSTLTIANGRAVILSGGAQAKNVFYQVGSSATIGTTAVLEGNILALTSISVATGATVNGRLLARNGAVTLDENAVTAPEC